MYERVALDLARIGPSVEPALTIALRDRNADVRLASLLALRHFEQLPSAAISNIVALLQDSKCEIRVEAAVLLTRLHRDELSVLPILGQALTPKSRPPQVSPHARVHAVEAFGRLETRHAEFACRHLTDAVEDPESSVRVAACEALWGINHDDAVVPQLCEELDAALRFHAPNDLARAIAIIDLLGKIGATPKLSGAALLERLAPHLSRSGVLAPYSTRVVTALRRIDPEVKLEVGVQEPMWLVREPVTIKVGEGHWVFENKVVELDPAPSAVGGEVHDQPNRSDPQ